MISAAAAALLVASVSALATSTRSPAGVTLMNQMPLKNVAFAELIDNALILSTFDGTPIFGKDGVYALPQPAGLVSKTSGAPLTPKQIPGSVTWPNTATKAPASVFGEEGIVVAGGFLVPGKSNGGLWYAEGRAGNYQSFKQIFGAKGYFYHQATFYDVDQDGNLDILSCRATKPMFGDGQGDLVWLQPADRANPKGPWKEALLGKGCDTFFVVEDVNGDGVPDILAAEFWGKKITLIQSPAGKFDDPSTFTYTTVDDSIGAAFDLSLVDLNNDGKKEILATNHDGSGQGGVYAYEIPANVHTDKFVRHDLATGFPVLQKGFGQAAPGQAQAFYPDLTAVAGKKPSIVVAGDGSQQAYLLTPDTEAPYDWTFTRTVLHDCGSTVGGIAVGDVDGDGKTDLFIPCYDKGYLAAYSFGK